MIVIAASVVVGTLATMTVVGEADVVVKPATEVTGESIVGTIEFVSPETGTYVVVVVYVGTCADVVVEL